MPGLFDDFSGNLQSVLPIALNYDHHDSSVQEWITQKIKDFYFSNNLNKEKEKNVTNVIWLCVNLTKYLFLIIQLNFFQLFTDGWFLEAMDQYLELRLSHKNIAPTYAYLFTHKGAASFTEIFKGGRENYWGEQQLVEIL